MWDLLMDSDGAQYDAEGRQPGILDPTTEALTGYHGEYLLGLNGEQVTVLNGPDFRPALRCRAPDPLFC
jgi:hypothetical protein